MRRPDLLPTLRGLAHAALAVAVAGLAIATAAAAAGWPWPLTLAEHFRIQLVALAGAGAAAALALRAGVVVDVALMVAIANFGAVAPSLRAARPGPAAADATRVKVLFLNVHMSSDAFADVRALIDALDPDLIALAEVDRRWTEGLAPSLARYPGRIEVPRRDNFGVALYHKRPLLAADALAIGSEWPTLRARIDTGGAPLTVFVTHPIPPVRGSLVPLHARQLAGVAEEARRTAGPRIVLGDLNTTPWSHAFRRFLAASRLRDSRDGFGLGGSFPTDARYPGLAWLLRIPIDHCLVSTQVVVVERRIERDVGSDHLPVYLELAVAGGDEIAAPEAPSARGLR